MIRNNKQVGGLIFNTHIFIVYLWDLTAKWNKNVIQSTSVFEVTFLPVPASKLHSLPNEAEWGSRQLTTLFPSSSVPF